MQKNYCEEKILSLQSEYPFLLEIGYSLKRAKEYLSSLNQKIQKEQNKNKACLFKHKENKKDTKKRKKKSINHTIELVDQQLLLDLKNQRQVLINYIRYLKRYYQIKQQEEIERQEAVVLTSRQQQLWIEALNHCFDNFKLHDYDVIYSYALNQEQYKDVLTDIVNQLQILYAKANIEQKEEIAIYFSNLRQKTNQYLLHLENKDPFLKQLSKSLQNYRKLHDVSTSPLEEEKDALEDFLEILLTEDTSYPYLEKILHQPIPYRDMVNFKVHGKHILFYIQELLLNSCLIELMDQTKDYIVKEYYKKVWQLFYFHPALVLTDDQRQELDANVEAFILAIQKHKYKKAPTMQKFLYDIGKKEEKIPLRCPETFTACHYGKYRDLTEEYTFSFYDQDPNKLETAYSVKLTDKGTFMVKVHIVDITSTVLENSELDEYLKGKMFKNENFIPEDILSKYIYLQKDDKQEQLFLNERLNLKKRPVITYELEVDGKGQIHSSKAYRSQIVVNQAFQYGQVSLADWRNDEYLYPACYLYYAAYDKKTGKVGYELEQVLQSFVKRMVGQYLSKSNLPMIYYLQEEPNDDLYVQYMKRSSYIFGRMNIEEAHILNSILKENINYAYLGLQNTGHFSLEDHFCLHLFHPCNSYIDIIVQRLLKFYFSNQTQTIDTEYITHALNDIVTLANERLADIRKESKAKKLTKQLTNA